MEPAQNLVLTPDIFKTILLYTLAGFTVLAVGLTAVFCVVFWKNDKGSIEHIGSLAEKIQLLKFATTILIVLSASLLGLLGVIDSNAIVAILSGISGYVLGTEKVTSRPRSPEPNQST